MKGDWEKIARQEIAGLFPSERLKIEKADLGTYADKKYIVEARQGKFLVKLTSKYNLRGNLPRVAELVKEKGVPLHTSVKFCYSKRLKCYCSAYPWLEGKNLEQMWAGLTAEEQIAWGAKCGKIMKRVHSVEGDYRRDKIRRPKREYNHYHFYCWLKKIDFPHKREFDLYFKENAGIFQGRPVCFVHMDFQPKNIMVCNDGQSMYLIDYENCMITDPWMDFMCNLYLCPPERQNFTLGLLRGYFPEGAPEEFYQATSLMGVLALYRYAMWKYQKNGKMVVQSANGIYEMYDGLTNVVPRNLRGKV